MQGAVAPQHVGRDAGTRSGQAIHVAVALRAQAGEARGVRVAARARVVLEEAVAEDPGRVMGDERVLALPAAAVCRVVGVEVEQPAVAVRGRSEVRCPEAVHGLAEIRVATEQMVEAAVVDPVLPDLDLGEVGRPVREVELPLAQAGGPGREAEVGKLNLPLLERPVAAVRRLAAGDHPRKGGAIVGAAAVPEGLPVELVVLAPAARVVELEALLADRPVGLPRVDRAPGEHVLRLTAHGSVGDERFALAVHRELDVAHVAVDELGSRSGGGERRRKRKHGKKHQGTSTHEGDPSHRQNWPHDLRIGRSGAAL